MTTIVLDFDGFLHAYESGWTGPKPTDPPVPGALDFVRELADRGFELVVVSSRAETGEGLAGICAWLIQHGFPEMRVTYGKAQGDAYIDDRAVPFRGDFDQTRRDLDRLLDHPKWWVPRETTTAVRRSDDELRARLAKVTADLESPRGRQARKMILYGIQQTLLWALGEESDTADI